MMSMIQVITSTVDVLLAWFVAAVIATPYIVSVIKTDPNDSALAAIGEIYYDLFYMAMRYHIVETLGICALLFFFGSGVSHIGSSTMHLDIPGRLSNLFVH